MDALTPLHRTWPRRWRPAAWQASVPQPCLMPHFLPQVQASYTQLESWPSSTLTLEAVSTVHSNGCCPARSISKQSALRMAMAAGQALGLWNLAWLQNAGVGPAPYGLAGTRSRISPAAWAGANHKLWNVLVTMSWMEASVSLTLRSTATQASSDRGKSRA